MWQKFKCWMGFHPKGKVWYYEAVYIGPLWGWRQMKLCKECNEKWV